MILANMPQFIHAAFHCSTPRNCDRRNVPLPVSSIPELTLQNELLTFSYRLLGLSAFAGFGILILGWPLNSFLARRSVRIQKGVLTARDKRMGVLNELIGAVSDKLCCWPNRSNRFKLMALDMNRLNSSNSLLGRNDGLIGQWMLVMLRWGG